MPLWNNDPDDLNDLDGQDGQDGHGDQDDQDDLDDHDLDDLDDLDDRMMESFADDWPYGIFEYTMLNVQIYPPWQSLAPETVLPSAFVDP